MQYFRSFAKKAVVSHHKDKCLSYRIESQQLKLSEKIYETEPKISLASSQRSCCLYVETCFGITYNFLRYVFQKQ